MRGKAGSKARELAGQEEHRRTHKATVPAGRSGGASGTVCDPRVGQRWACQMASALALRGN